MAFEFRGEFNWIAWILHSAWRFHEEYGKLRHFGLRFLRMFYDSLRPMHMIAVGCTGAKSLATSTTRSLV